MGIVASGNCGDNLIWTLDENKTLTISGTGEMFDYSGNVGGPWFSYGAVYSLVIENGVTSIGVYAFDYGTSLTSINLPNSLTSIKAGAFRNCSSLSSITIPEGVSIIGNNAFENCYSLSSILLPDTLTKISNYAFACCSSLTSIALPNSLTSIGSYAFQRCSGLSYLSLPDNLTSIWDHTFAYCTSLTNITLPQNIVGINDSAFSYCSGLTSISLPKSVSYIGSKAFYQCSSLADVYYADTEERWKLIIINSDNHILINAIIHCIDSESLQDDPPPEDPENPEDPTGDPTDIANCSTTIIGHTFEYTGSANKPVVMGVRAKGGVELKESTDYTVEYQNNIEIGHGKVIIKGCGNYKGEKIETFEIIPGKVKWEKVNYDILDGNMKDADFIWKTLDYIKGSDSGYQIRYCDDHYSLDSDHAVYLEYVAGNTNGKETIDNLQLNSTIKFQINAYKVVEGEKFEGEWSVEEKLNIGKSKLSFPWDFWSFHNLSHWCQTP